MTQQPFIIIGENIHCTRSRLTNGSFVTELAGGRYGLVFKDGTATRTLPVPEAIVAGEEWANGKVRHVAVAVWQGLYGQGAEQAVALDYIRAMARDQEEAGAAYLDLNVDEFSTDNDEKLRAVVWAVNLLQEASPLPVSVDSSNLEIIRAGVKACNPNRSKPLVNSVSLERVDAISIAAESGAGVVAGAGGASGMPENMEERLANTAVLMAMLEEHGLARNDIYLDPLVYPVSVKAENSLDVLETIRELRHIYGPDIHFAPGISNISFGLPKRPLINQVFARLCREHGCDGGIVDPRQINGSLLDSLDTESIAYRLTADLLLGRDEYGMEYISATRDGTI
ncbi:MAG: dihydropteroate synthase [Lentisphaerae bacterium]|jgi:5-methyltetrahydrofolate--homocysteine methyltransferase|nr:dihydropteroate synthase [Lentisphaerota bacterium]